MKSTVKVIKIFSGLFITMESVAGGAKRIVGRGSEKTGKEREGTAIKTENVYII